LSEAPNGSKPVVLYIGGEGRSGSTLLSTMLGQFPGFQPVGELRGIWQAAKTDELCGCGVPFSQCGFWTRVGAKAFGGWDSVDIGKMLALDAQYGRHRFVPRLVIPALRRRHHPDIADFTAILYALYTGLHEVAGGAVIVDSTKDASYAFLLHAVSGLDLRLVHLVRDSRGVAYSWEKKRIARPEYVHHPTLSGTFMDRRKPRRSALEWNGKNVLFHYLGHTGVHRLLVRYESLVENPDVALRQVCTLSDVPVAALAETSRGNIASAEYRALPHHTLGGNRIRFARGRVRLRADTEWQSAMTMRQRLMVTVLTFPFLLAYGYIGRLRVT
jgi:hypothetical protein